MIDQLGELITCPIHEGDGADLRYAFTEHLRGVDLCLIMDQVGELITCPIQEGDGAIRPTALGKKNWLFIGNAQAGERNAIVFKVIEACRRRGMDLFEYLRDVFTRMPTMAAQDYASLAPEEWAKACTPAKPTRKAPAADANNQQRRCA